MPEFTRNTHPDNLFEGTSDEIVEVYLKIKDDFDDRFNRNPENKLRAEQVRQILSLENRVCFFQKQKNDDLHNKSRHKIIIPIGNDRAIETIVGLWIDKIDTFTELYSYRVAKFKEIPFFNDPTKHTIKRNCVFQFVELEIKSGTSAESFKELYKNTESCEIPLVDINKEKDREIWKNYVIALKKLVKQKEQVWKIQDIKTPYTETRDGEYERVNYIDIFINENELIEHLEKDIEDLFNPNELEDYGVSEDKAFIEFKTFRELNQEELNQLKELGEELFYELSNNSPTHYISGEIVFKYTGNISKEEIFEEIKSKLQSEYQLECSINKEGYIDLEENDIPHLQKIIEDNWDFLLTIYKDNLVKLKVDFNNVNELVQLKQKVKSRLNSEGLNRGIVSISEDNKNIIIELGAYIPPAKFTTEGLQFVMAISRFIPNRQIKTKPVDGLDLIGNTYQLTNASKEQVDDALRLLQETFHGVSFRRLPTLYFFKLNERANIKTLRNFKTKTDLPGKTEFALVDSTLTINPESKADYEAQLKRLKESFPTATIETKLFKPTFQIQFKTDLESKRQSIINKIQNEVRKTVGKAIEFDVLKKHTRVLFSYQFKSEEERENFKHAINTTCSEHQKILESSFENHLGRTIYELFKNETLELEKEKEVAGNVRQATFIYLTPEQKEQLNEKIELFGDEAIFKEGMQIGKLVRKDGNKLKFRITGDFDDSLNAKEKDRLDLNEIRRGYIKPIFPGELTNIARMIRAMKKVTEPGAKVGYPVNQNLCNFLFDPNEARQSAANLEDEKQKILADLNEPLLKEQQKQLEAVAKTLVAKDMALIQGPPGTGKTTVIAEIIWQVLSREPQSKLLITSQTNLAVDNALERLSGKKLVRPIRIGNIDKFEDEGKVYSNDRIKKWIQAKVDTREEEINSTNAVCEWIDNVLAKCSEDEKYSKAISKWKKGLEAKDVLIKNTFSNAYYKYINVFAATCSECGSPRFSEAYQESFQKDSERRSEPEFDIVIMDEASKATPPELVLPLTLGEKVIIIGDHKQLPPMIDEQEFSEALEAVGAKNLIEHWTKEDYKVSQFEKLFKNAPKNFVASLDTQFRMHEQIMNCISQFYTDQEELENGLICGIKGEMNIPDLKVKASRWHGMKLNPFIDPKNHAIWINVETPENRVGTSYENTGEIAAIQTVLKALTKADGFLDYLNHFNKDEDKEIGIITYYMPQMQNIRNAIYPTFGKNEWRNFEQHKYNNEFQLPFRINTVDRFQGMERNIIIISTVRSNLPVDKNYKWNKEYPFSLGFARDFQRINVGFSRAKRLLLVIGNQSHFSRKPEYLKAIQNMHSIDIKQIQNLIAL